MIDRKEEIRALLKLPPVEVVARAGNRLTVLNDLGALHGALAADIVAEIVRNSRAGKPTRLILPVGPTGQYPILVQEINRKSLSLANCHFFFMDEYCGEDGNAVGVDHPLGLRRQARELFLDKLAPGTAPPGTQVAFPDQGNVSTLAPRMASLGGIDVCYGGIGIHGHLAFNEPEPGVARTDPRKVRLNDFTVTMNALRAEVGGNLACFPRYAFTLGMNQILGARRIVLACRNGSPYDWANTVLRLALLGVPGDDYPVTHIRSREYRIYTDRQTLASPKHIV